MNKEELQIVVKVIQTVIDDRVKEVIGQFVGGIIESIEGLDGSIDKMLNEIAKQNKKMKSSNLINGDSLSEILNTTQKKVRYKDTTGMNQLLDERYEYIAPNDNFSAREVEFDEAEVAMDAFMQSFTANKGRNIVGNVKAGNLMAERMELEQIAKKNTGDLPTPEKIQTNDVFLDGNEEITSDIQEPEVIRFS